MNTRISSVPVAQPPVAARYSSALPSANPQVELSVPKVEIQVNTEAMKKNLEAAISHLNEVMRDGGRGLSFELDPSLKGQPVIIVRKEDTGEVVRQIPSPEVLKVAHSIDALKGLLMNKEI